MQNNIVRRILGSEDNLSSSEGEDEDERKGEAGGILARRTSSRVAATAAPSAAAPAIVPAVVPAVVPAAAPAAAALAAAKKSTRQARDAARALAKRQQQATPLTSRQIGQSVGAAHARLVDMLGTSQPDLEEIRLAAQQLRMALATPGYKPCKKTAGKYKNALASAESHLQPPVQPPVQPMMQPKVQPPVQPLMQPPLQPPMQPPMQPSMQPYVQPAYVQPPMQPGQSPPGDVRAMMKQLRGLKAAQAIPGQEPSALAARAQQMDGLECDIEERERKFRKYGSW